MFYSSLPTYLTYVPVHTCVYNGLTARNSGPFGPFGPGGSDPLQQAAVACMHPCLVNDLHALLPLWPVCVTPFSFRPRAVKLMAALVALLTPQVVEGLMQLMKALLTDERLTR